MSLRQLLSLALAVQLVLAVITWWPEDRSALLPHPFLALSADAVDELRIASKPADGEELDWLHLVREADDWTIASEGRYPAERDKVEAVIEQLLAMQVRSPIATREASHNSLKVGEDEYGRRVAIRTGEDRYELVLGAAKSNSVNVRRADATEVYLATGLSEWSIRDDARSYWDSSYVSADPNEITALRLSNRHGTLGFTRGDDGWRLAEPTEDASLDREEIERFLRTVTSVRMNDPVGTEIKPEYGLDSGIRVSWTLEAENESVAGGYVVGAASDSFRYVKSDSSPYVVKVNESSLQELSDATAKKFIAKAGDAGD